MIANFKHNLVFIISVIIISAIALFAILYDKAFLKIANGAFDFFTINFSWLYLLVMFLFVIFIFFIACSKYGTLKLGADDSKPEYSNFSWFAMLFCAGTGIGLVFWSISEPISHYITPMDGIQPYTPDAADFAFKSVFMNWGIHPWTSYAVLGLALAYFQYRKNKICLISSVLEPIISKKCKYVVCKVIDILSALVTAAGIVTSLGLGVLQINSGLNMVFHIPNTLKTQISIIIIITIIFIGSAISGIGNGVKKLSNINLVLAIIFVFLTIAIGPKIEMINNLVNGVGSYLGDFFIDSLKMNSYSDNSWVINWRVFYWAWWISWTPFVSMFIARISKGRTIREFILGVVFIPTVMSVIWFSVFGTTGLHMCVYEILSKDELYHVASNPEFGLFVVLQQYPIGILLSVIAIVLLLIFFVTSADSGTFVLSMITSGGDLEPSNRQKILWGMILSLLAVALLLVGGLKPLQTISIVAAFPFIFIMIGACVSLIKNLREEKLN